MTLLLLFLFNSFGGFVNTAHAASEPINVWDGVTATWSTGVFVEGTPVTLSNRFVFPDSKNDARGTLWFSFQEVQDVVTVRGSSQRNGAASFYFYDEFGEVIGRHVLSGTTPIMVSFANVKTIALVSFYYGLPNTVSNIEVWANYIPPPEDVTFSFSDVKADSVTLHYSAREGTYTDFSLFQDDVLISSTTAAGSKLIGGLKAATYYNFRLEVFNESKRVTKSLSVKTADLPSPVPVISSFQVTSVSHDRVTLSWSASDAKLYSLYRDGVLIKTMPGVSSGTTDFGLSPGTRYEYKLVAENDTGTAEMSLEAMTDLEPPPVPPGPPPSPMPTPPPSTGLPDMPPPDTGNEDLDEKLTDMGGALEALKNGAMIIIFWAIVIAIGIFGARWLFIRWKMWMGLPVGGSGGKGRSGGRGGSGGGRRSGGNGGSRGAYRTQSHNGKEYKVYEGSYDSRDKGNSAVSNALKKFT